MSRIWKEKLFCLFAQVKTERGDNASMLHQDIKMFGSETNQLQKWDYHQGCEKTCLRPFLLQVNLNLVLECNKKGFLTRKNIVNFLTVEPCS